MKKVLVTGAAGQLGATLELNEYITIKTDLFQPGTNENITMLDITDEDQVKILLDNEKPDIIVHLAAMTNVDGCELNPDQAQLINVQGTVNLLNHFDGKFMLISSDYVFDGKDGPYREEDEVHPINVYGQTKLDAEEKVRECSNDWIILRTNVVWNIGGNFKASFADWVVEELKNNRKIQIVDDQWNNPTWTVDLSRVIGQLLHFDASGVYHYGSANILNRYKFASLIANVYELNDSLIEPITTKELNQPAKRPLKCGLITDKIKRDFNILSSKTHMDIKEAKMRTIQ
ncbi:MAG: SDR family oxidoreductase [Candidatus Marinimicrobia bacterium]|nr:SDR family oxidoreductase [Candidatus Neomarinimicrobiota bacterium]